ncbi:MAG: MBOAT family O-acyltransferase [Actinomycetota bacterium]
MLFNSITYAIFLPVVLGLYWALRHRQQNVLLLIASYIFYGAWDYRFLALIWISTLIDFIVGILLGRTDDEAQRKRMFLISVAANLTILGFFKYFGFFVDSFVSLVGNFGLRPNVALFEILLPVGISFYTFQSLSYGFDVYRRRMEPTKSLLNFATFVAYFPQLVAGPIERAAALLPQIERERTRPSAEQFRSGLFMILMGLFKKVAIADAVAPIANDAFGNAGEVSSATLVLGVLAFSLQIYGDFSGYSDIARGSSRLFGIELMRNFEQPYLSRSITEFWRTWHISLSSWLHDYLYVPLGGNKGGKWLTYRNLMLTMLLGGLWHGANWTFVVWGGMHGLLLALHRAIGGYVPRGRPPVPRLRDVPAVLTTFISVALLWIFFRADSLTDAWNYFGGLLAWRPGPADVDSVMVIAFSVFWVLVIDVSQRITADHAVIARRWHPIPRGMAYAVMFLAVVMWSGGAAQQFIYFQF